VDDRDAWLAPTQAARRLGVDERTVRRQADRGLFRVVRTLGGHRRLWAAHVEQAARAQPTRTPSRPPRSTTVPYSSIATDAARASLAAWAPGDPTWITSTQAVSLLQVSQPYVTQLSNAGKLPYEPNPDVRRLYRPAQIEVIARTRRERTDSGDRDG